MDALASYGGSSDEESNSPRNSPRLIASSSLIPSVNPTAPVEIKEDILKLVPVDPHSNELIHNPRYDQLFAPQVINHPFIIIDFLQIANYFVKHCFDKAS